MAKIKHIALSTRDPEKTARFYVDMFGMKQIGRVDHPAVSGYLLSDGDLNVTVLKFKNDAVAGAERGKDYVGIHHNGFQVRSADQGECWERLGFPDDGTEVWSILVHPANPRILYAGTSPVGVYRSDDRGDTWRRLPKAAQPERVKMKSFACCVMRLVADPARPDELYAALEVGGVMRSLGSSDLLKLAELPHLKSTIDSDSHLEGMLDGHAVCVSAARPGTVFLAVRMGLFQSADRGAGWQTWTSAASRRSRTAATSWCRRTIRATCTPA